MNNIYIDYDNGLELGNKINQEYEEIKLLSNNLIEILEKIKNNSEKDKSLKTIINQAKVINKFNSLIGETGKLLVNVSNAYKNVENASKSEEA